MQRFETVSTAGELAALTARLGVLPFFAGSVEGWSLEENVDPAVWFTDREGPWEWKGPLCYEKRCVYAKLIRGRAAFVSLEWFADLANWRRQAMSYEEREEAGLAPYKDRLLMRYLAAHPCELSRNARRECGFTTGYDAVLTRLEMQTYVVNQDFRYSVDRHGRPYGWGNAAIARAEDWLGPEALRVPGDREPEDSFERLVKHLLGQLPGADEAALRRALE